MFLDIETSASALSATLLPASPDTPASIIPYVFIVLPAPAVHFFNRVYQRPTSASYVPVDTVPPSRRTTRHRRQPDRLTFSVLTHALESLFSYYF